jgi:GH35 family endo-1,4-beta-xylanase
MIKNQNAKSKLTERITALFLALVLTACSVTPVSTPSPSVPPATEAIPTPTEMAIELEGEVFTTTEDLPEEITPSMDLFTEMAESDGLDIDELHPILWLKATQGELSVNYALLRVATVSDLTDPDGEPGNPKPVYYIAYRDEQGQMQGGYVLGKLIEKDNQGVSYVARMLSEETFRNWQNNTQPEDGSYTVGQVVYSVPLREAISVEQARTMQAKLNSGKLSSEDFMENYAEGVAFIQPGQEKQVVGIDKSAPELIAKPFWQELFSGVTEAQAASLEFSSEPEPTPTPLPTLSAELTGGIEGIPDPRITNPEIFYVDKKMVSGKLYTSPIVDYATAKNMSQNTEQISTGIKYESYLDSSGQMFLVGYYSQDGQKTPLLIYDLETENWSKILLPDLVSKINPRVSVGTYATYFDSNMGEIVANNARIMIIENDTKWSFFEKEQGIFDSSRRRHIKEQIYFAKEHNIDIIGGPFLYWIAYPDWVRGLPKEQIKAELEEYITYTITSFGKDIKYWIVGNEYHPLSNGDHEDYLQSQFTSDEEDILLFASRVARRVADQVNPEIKLIYNDNKNHIKDKGSYHDTKSVVDLLRAEGLVDIVGFEMHDLVPENNAGKPTSQNIIDSIDAYGLSTMFTEVDADFTRRNGPINDQAQVENFKIMLEACLNSQSCLAFIQWDIGKPQSLFITGDDGQITPKAGYYDLLAYLLTRLQSASHQ